MLRLLCIAVASGLLMTPDVHQATQLSHKQKIPRKFLQAKRSRLCRSLPRRLKPPMGQVQERKTRTPDVILRNRLLSPVRLRIPIRMQDRGR